ncbi:hypothetical protein EVAR_41192_1 [Eumeta japonica]|uniref:Uncharacterized protein n=1 Tax=Eumeta variegata TaxID=151549 RepID=A0A4C1WTD6_EUMVA|nr:hypothetical protein EVAR_41192_1 [Eumeta japonica]
MSLSTWLQHKNGSAQPMRYHTLTEYRRQITTCTVALSSRYTRSELYVCREWSFSTAREFYKYPDMSPVRDAVWHQAVKTAKIK